MYIGRELFERSLAVMDEILPDGTISQDDVAELEAKAPYLLDMWQKEASNRGNLYNIQEYENTDADNVNKWTNGTLPSSLRKINDVIFIDDDSQISSIKYKKFGNSDIYIYFKKTGTARMLYTPIPTEITSLDQTLEIDDFVATSGAYYLAEQFAIADQNTELAAMCRRKFENLISESAGTDALEPTEIEDVYFQGGD